MKLTVEWLSEIWFILFLRIFFFLSPSPTGDLKKDKSFDMSESELDR